MITLAFYTVIHTLIDQFYTVGRDRELCNIWVEGDRSLSRLHFSLVRLSADPHSYWLVDGDPQGYRKSRNGVSVNGKRVEGGQMLKGGDRLVAGNTVFIYRVEGRELDSGKLTVWN